jgi:hypothetical protein
MAPGEVAEWSIAPHSKCGIGEDRWRAGQGIGPVHTPLTDAIGKLADVADRQFQLMASGGRSQELAITSTGPANKFRQHASPVDSGRPVWIQKPRFHFEIFE